MGETISLLIWLTVGLDHDTVVSAADKDAKLVKLGVWVLKFRLSTPLIVVSTTKSIQSDTIKFNTLHYISIQYSTIH